MIGSRSAVRLYQLCLDVRRCTHQAHSPCLVSLQVQGDSTQIAHGLLIGESVSNCPQSVARSCQGQQDHIVLIKGQVNCRSRVTLSGTAPSLPLLIRDITIASKLTASQLSREGVLVKTVDEILLVRGCQADWASPRCFSEFVGAAFGVDFSALRTASNRARYGA